jgi:AcrR family transcriptional regulator
MPSPSAERIYQQATRLFGERGYPSTSMRDIGEAVGILAGSLYSHISSKEALLLDIIEHAIDRYLATITPLAQADTTPDVRLREAIKAHVHLVADNVEETLVSLHQWKYLSDVNRKRIASKRQACEHLFVAILDDGMRDGTFKPVAHPKITVAGIIGMLNWVPEWFSPKGSETPEQIGDELADLALSGLVPNPQERP